MKPTALVSLALLTALLTGCPRNEYIVELRPHGSVMDRTLTFFRADGVDTNGVPDYQSFPSNELAAITGLYPASGVKREGERHTATGVFGTTLPPDVGGHGSFTNLVTSLGNAGYYLERFRGNADLASQIRQRSEAADQLADWIVGWSQAELGREPHYPDLRRFLDQDFRHDLQNLGLYAWLGDISSSYKAGFEEEFIARFGQYLLERGRLKWSDAPALLQIGEPEGEFRLAQLVQRLLAEKLGILASDPTPPALAFIAHPEAVSKSWEKYLAGTDRYRAKLQEWEQALKSDPEAKKPEPTELAGECAAKLFVLGTPGSDDRLTVRLSLSAEPTHTNGRWDKERKQVVWEEDLGAPGDDGHWPALCYANWSSPDEQTQRRCFGRVALSGDRLVQYCLWRVSLDEDQAREWEGLLASLRPDPNLTDRIGAFRFADELAPSETNTPPAAAATSGIARDLIQAALQDVMPVAPK